MLNKEMSAGTNAEQSTNDETRLPSSPTCGNTHVVRSPKSAKKSVIKDLHEMSYLQKEYFQKREQSYRALIKMWGLDIP